MKQPSRVPLWMLIIIIVVALPVLAFPTLLSMSANDISDIKVLVWIYPFYVIVAAYLAWQSYGRRTEMTWILLILILISHLSLWYLLLNPNN